MPRQGTSARRPRPHRIVQGLLCAAAMQLSTASHAEEPRSRSEHRIVYRCVHDGVLTLTDTPCQGDRIDIDLNRNLSSAPPAAARVREKGRETPRKPAVSAMTESLEKQAERCRRLRAQLATLQSKMRSGYTAAAGIRLEERKRQLREQARSAKCP